MTDFETKYDPTDLASVVFHDTYTEQAIRAYEKGQTFRSLVLYGDFGTGKSSLAKLLPKAITKDVQGADIKLLNASADRSLTAIKNLEGFCSTVGFNSAGFRFVILDETDGLKPDAFDALKGILDRYKGGVLFIFTTNDFGKIPGAIKSRSTCLNIDHAPANRWLDRARWILRQEGFERSDEQLLPLIKCAKGDNRKILQLLQELVCRLKKANATAKLQMPPNTVACMTPPSTFPQ